MEPITTGLALFKVGDILANVFGNLFGASKQANAAEKAAKINADAALRAAGIEKQAMDDQLAFLKYQDQRDYGDWLSREARDRKDWEISEQRKAPFRALADSAVRTLADYVRVPGMVPAQEIPVQQWTAPQQPVSTTMPVGPPTLAGYAQRGPAPVMDSALAKYGRRTLKDYAL